MRSGASRWKMEREAMERASAAERDARPAHGERRVERTRPAEVYDEACGVTRVRYGYGIQRGALLCSGWGWPYLSASTSGAVVAGDVFHDRIRRPQR